MDAQTMAMPGHPSFARDETATMSTHLDFVWVLGVQPNANGWRQDQGSGIEA